MLPGERIGLLCCNPKRPAAPRVWASTSAPSLPTSTRTDLICCHLSARLLTCTLCALHPCVAQKHTACAPHLPPARVAQSIKCSIVWQGFRDECMLTNSRWNHQTTQSNEIGFVSGYPCDSGVLAIWKGSCSAHHKNVYYLSTARLHAQPIWQIGQPGSPRRNCLPTPKAIPPPPPPHTHTQPTPRQATGTTALPV